MYHALNARTGTGITRSHKSQSVSLCEQYHKADRKRSLRLPITEKIQVVNRKCGWRV